MASNLRDTQRQVDSRAWTCIRSRRAARSASPRAAYMRLRSTGQEARARGERGWARVRRWGAVRASSGAWVAAAAAAHFECAVRRAPEERQCEVCCLGVGLNGAAHRVHGHKASYAAVHKVEQVGGVPGQLHLSLGMLQRRGRRGCRGTVRLARRPRLLAVGGRGAVAYAQGAAAAVAVQTLALEAGGAVLSRGQAEGWRCRVGRVGGEVEWQGPGVGSRLPANTSATDLPHILHTVQLHSEELERPERPAAKHSGPATARGPRAGPAWSRPCSGSPSSAQRRLLSPLAERPDAPAECRRAASVPAWACRRLRSCTARRRPA